MFFGSGSGDMELGYMRSQLTHNPPIPFRPTILLSVKLHEESVRETETESY